jgi:hypothetical protein
MNGHDPQEPTRDPARDEPPRQDPPRPGPPKPPPAPAKPPRPTLPADDDDLDAPGS